MKHLENWHEVKRALAPKAFLLFDYDGTLTPITKKPDLAVLSSDVKNLLRRVAEQFKVAVISGRSLSNIKKIVGLKGIYYAGNHGFEISGLGVKLILPEAKRARHVISMLSSELRGKLGQIEGTIVEDKGFTASIHYRLVVRKKLRRLKNIFEEIVRPYVTSGAIKVTAGKKVFEIRPNLDWGKGKAILWIIEVIDPKKRLTPVYIGDDQTDEDAFLALKSRGITVLVSEKRKRSYAKFFLRNVGEVKKFLKELTTMK